MKTLLKLTLASFAFGLLAPVGEAQAEAQTIVGDSIAGTSTEAPAQRRARFEAAHARFKAAHERETASPLQVPKFALPHANNESLNFKLYLTPAQKERVAVLNAKQAEELRAVGGDTVKKAAIADVYYEQVRALLTGEQKRKFDQFLPVLRRLRARH